MAQAEVKLVGVACCACHWHGRMPSLDVFDHPCPSCGRYTSLRLKRDSAANDNAQEEERT